MFEGISLNIPHTITGDTTAIPLVCVIRGVHIRLIDIWVYKQATQITLL